MGKKDPRVDAYIARSPDFAQPILKHIRKLVHKADPDIEETLKWGMPSLGHAGIVCQMAAFKRHCAFGFWKSKLILEPADAGMGSFGKITRRSDLPSDAKLVGYIKKAIKLNQQGAKVRGRSKRKATPLRVPAYLSAGLNARPKAAATFKAMSTSHRNEYVECIAGAKQAGSHPPEAPGHRYAVAEPGQELQLALREARVIRPAGGWCARRMATGMRVI